MAISLDNHDEYHEIIPYDIFIPYDMAVHVFGDHSKSLAVETLVWRSRERKMRREKLQI
jgi:hypothetical protein